MRAAKRVFTGQIGGGDWVESKLTCGSILKPLPTIAGGNSLHLWSWLPKKVEPEQVAQLMKTDPQDLGNLYKNSHWRELRLLILEKWSFRLNECTSEKFNGREIWKVFEGINADWSNVALSWRSYCREQSIYWGIELVSWQRVLLFAFSTIFQPMR